MKIKLKCRTSGSEANIKLKKTRLVLALETSVATLGAINWQLVSTICWWIHIVLCFSWLINSLVCLLFEPFQIHFLINLVCVVYFFLTWGHISIKISENIDFQKHGLQHIGKFFSSTNNYCFIKIILFIPTQLIFKY